MKQITFVHDLKRCFGCHGCVAACANVNKTKAGYFWRNLFKLPPEHGQSATVYLSISCNHCTHPPCVKACPTEALEKREKDGVVILHAESCMGCRYCRMACPYDAIQWDEEEGVIRKCHFCFERLDEGKDPACVETCFGHALTWAVAAEVEEREKEAPGLIHYKKVEPNIRFIGGDR